MAAFTIPARWMAAINLLFSITAQETFIRQSRFHFKNKEQPYY